MTAPCNTSIDCMFLDNDGSLLGLGMCSYEGLCECSTILGFKGPNCDILSGQSMFYIIFELQLLAALISFMIWVVWLMRGSKQLVRGDQGDSDTDRHILYNLRILFLLGISISSSALQALLQLIAYTKPSQVEFESMGKVIVYASPAKFIRFLGLISTMAGIYATVAICFSWIYLLEELSGVLTTIPFLRRLTRLKVLLVTLLLIAKVAIYFFFFEESEYWYFVVSIVATLLPLVLIGRVYLVDSLKNIGGEKVEATLHLIRRLSFHLGLSIIFSVILMIWTKSWKPHHHGGSNDSLDGSQILYKMMDSFVIQYPLYFKIQYCSSIYSNFYKKFNKELTVRAVNILWNPTNIVL